MQNSTTQISDSDFERLFKEYQSCREDASRLESYIWKTAGLLGVASGTGVVLRSTAGEHDLPHLVTTVLIAVLAINLSLIWWRFARRWWSIQHLKYERLDQIEKLIGFGQDINVGTRDREAMGDRLYLQGAASPFQRILNFLLFEIPPAIERKESKRTRSYEYRGNQPVTKLLVLTNVLSWLFIAIGEAFGQSFRYGSIVLLIFILVSLVDVWFWRKP